MSDKQLLSSPTAKETHDHILAETNAAPKTKDDATAKKRADRSGSRKRRPNYRRKASGSQEKAKDGKGTPKNSHSDLSTLLIGRRAAPAYVNLLKNILAQGKHEVMTLQGVGYQGNQKFIQLANNMVKWGYCAIVKI